MTGTTTIVAGIEVPSVSPVFLTMVAFHVVVGMACVITGLIAMGFCFRNCPGCRALG